MKKIIFLTLLLSVMFGGSAYAVDELFLHAPMDNADPNDIVAPIDPYTAVGTLLSTEDQNGSVDKAIELNKNGSGCLSYDTTFDTGEVTVSAWINPSWPAQSNQQLFATDNADAFRVWTRGHDGVIEGMRFWITFPTAGWQAITVNYVNSSGWKLLTVTYDGADMKMYVNGSIVGQILGINEPMPSASDLIVAIRTETTWDNGWQGDLSDLRVYNYGLTETEVSDLYDSYPTPPTIDAPLGTITVSAYGGTETFGPVSATNPETGDSTGLEYAWYHEDVLIAGETGDSLTLTNISADDLGEYKCRVTVTATGLFADAYGNPVHCYRDVAFYRGPERTS